MHSSGVILQSIYTCVSSNTHSVGPSLLTMYDHCAVLSLGECPCPGVSTCQSGNQRHLDPLPVSILLVGDLHHPHPFTPLTNHQMAQYAAEAWREMDRAFTSLLASAESANKRKQLARKRPTVMTVLAVDNEIYMSSSVKKASPSSSPFAPHKALQNWASTRLTRAFCTRQCRSFSE